MPFLERLLCREHEPLSERGRRLRSGLDQRLQNGQSRACPAAEQRQQQPLELGKEREALTRVIDQAIRTSPEYRKAGSSVQRDSVYAALRGDAAWIDSMKQAGRTIEVGFVILDPHNGGIRAMVGGSGNGLWRMTGATTTLSGNMVIASSSGSQGDVAVSSSALNAASVTIGRYGDGSLTIGSGSVTKSPDQTTYHSGDVIHLAATPAAGVGVCVAGEFRLREARLFGFDVLPPPKTP